MFGMTNFQWASLGFCVLLLSPLTTLYVLVSRNAKRRKLIRILCFGDSLTFGLTNGEPHPYTVRLQEYFRSKLRSHSRSSHVELYNAGRSGEQVQNEMLPRLENLLQAAKYNWVIILGGTNDLFGMKRIWTDNNMGKEQDQMTIFNALVQLHKVAHMAGAKTVAVTIPALQCEVSRKRMISVIMEVRLKVNEMIRNFVKNSKGKVLLADIDKDMHFSRDQMLCGDGIHLTASAYDRMAYIIFNSIKDFI